MAAPPSRKCEVIGSTKFLAESGGAEALCAAVDRTARAHLSGKARVTVRVLSASRLSATIRTSAGVLLPVQDFAVSDARLSRTTIEHFAQAVADALTQAHR